MKWISSPRYRDAYERVKRDRFPGSGQEFLLEPRYLSWRRFFTQAESSGNSQQPGSAWLSRMLSIQGKLPIPRMIQLANRL